MTIRTLVAIGALASMTVLACPMTAESAPGRPSAREASAPQADALFVEGKKLFDARKFSEACEKLAASERLSPTVRSLALLAACHEEQGRLATAFAEHLGAAERAGKLRDGREPAVRKRAAALKPSIPVLLIAVPRPTPGLTITQNGKAVEVDVVTEIYVDPGPVEIVAQAPGKKAWRTQVTAAPKERTSVRVPQLAAEESEPLPAPKPVPRRAPPVALPSGPPAVHVVGVIAGGFGLAALALGSGFGIAAIQANAVAKRDDGCNAKNLCTEASAQLREFVLFNANVATGLLALGAVVVAGGVTLLLIPKRPPPQASSRARPLRVTATGDPRGVGVMVSGSF